MEIRTSLPLGLIGGWEFGFREKFIRHAKSNAAFTMPDCILRNINANATKRALSPAKVAPPPFWFTNQCFFPPLLGAASRVFREFLHAALFPSNSCCPDR
jgi:hypothetical protein